jgi:hypothetical protein
MTRFRMAILAAVVTFIAAAPAAAQSETQQILVSQLEAATALMENDGFRPYTEFGYGRLGEDGKAVFTLVLEGGRSYAILGVCDEDCDDLDLELAEVDGNVVDSDFELDDVPIVTVDVPYGATFNLSVIMAACDASWCGYGIGVFARE